LRLEWWNALPCTNTCEDTFVFAVHSRKVKRKMIERRASILQTAILNKPVISNGN